MSSRAFIAGVSGPELAAAEREFIAALAANEASADYLRPRLDVVQPQSLKTPEWRERVKVALAAKQPVDALTELIRQKPH